MVQDSGSVPLSFKGVVVGMNAKSMDVIWDAPFMSGSTLGDRCSQYRGSTVEFSSCLNLTNPQFVASTNPQAPTQQQPQSPFKPRFGPHPSVRPPPGQQPAAGFRPAPYDQSCRCIASQLTNDHFSQHANGNDSRSNGASQGAPVHIMTNPNRGRGASRGGPPAAAVPHVQAPNGNPNGHAKTVPPQNAHIANGNGFDHAARGRGRGRGFEGRNGFAPGRGGVYAQPARGRGFPPGVERGRGGPPRGGARGGRGRGQVPA